MRIRLIRPHTHAGVLHHTGEALDIPEHDARWLIMHGMAESVPEDKPSHVRMAEPIRKTKSSPKE